MSATKHWDGPGLEAWEPWSPQIVASLLAGTDAPWCIVGGWAIDLFLGRPTRAHEDIEIGVAAPFYASVLSRLNGYALHSVGDGEVRRMAAGESLPADQHQCWVLDETANKWRLDVMCEPGDRGTWQCRRDARIAVPRARIVAVSSDGIPYLRPEGALLFKAKAARPKDETDFANCLPAMDAGARQWLRDALTLVHPGHAWLGRLDG